VDVATFSRLTGAIYDSAANPERWPFALREIQQVFRARAVSLISRDMTTMKGCWISTHDPATEREFWGKFFRRNPFAVAAVNTRPRPVETDQDILPKSELVQTEYYNEFWQRLDVHANLQLWLEREGPVQPSLSVARSRSAGDFEAADVELGRLLLPHVQRAVTLERRLDHTALTENGAADALGSLRHGILILDETGRPVHLNRAAEQLIGDGDGLCIDNGRLRAATPSLTQRLDALLARAAGQADDLPSGGAASLPRPSGKTPLALVAVPLRQELDWLRPRRPMICVCVSDPADGPAIPAAFLATLFGLTAAEAAIAGDLVAGLDVRAIAEQRDITPRTVRLHLSRIMAKTDTRRQAELVRLLMNIAPFCAEH
jgi:DNA-binding CsgD family transcriptional regulator